MMPHLDGKLFNFSFFLFSFCPLTTHRLPDDGPQFHFRIPGGTLVCEGGGGGMAAAGEVIKLKVERNKMKRSG